MPSASTNLQRKIKRASQQEVLDSIPDIGKLAREGNVQAFTALQKGGGLIDSGGIKIQNQIGVDARNHGDNEADWKFFQKFRGRLDASLLRGALPPPDEGDDAPKTSVAEVRRETPQE